jgi:hypothetical protein
MSEPQTYFWMRQEAVVQAENILSHLIETSDWYARKIRMGVTYYGTNQLVSTRGAWDTGRHEKIF